MKPITLTKQQSRRFLLAYQGLWYPRTLKSKAGILDYYIDSHIIGFRVSNRQAGFTKEVILINQLYFTRG